MRICFMCQEDILKPQGGTGTYVRNVGMVLARRGHDVHAIARRRGDAPAFEEVEGVKVHRVDAPGPPVLYSPLYFNRSRMKFMQLQEEAPFDLVQGNMPLMSSWGLTGAALPPVVETVHCTVREELKALARGPQRQLNLNEVLAQALAGVWLDRERRLLERARKVISVSEGLKRELVEQYGYSPEQVEVIPNGVDYARFSKDTSHSARLLRRKLGIAPDEQVVLYLGRLMERKRVIDLVRALPLVRREVPNVRLVIVGRRNANAERIEQAARELYVSGKVTMVDHVSYDEVPSYYAMADVYALPSAYEGFPFTILEAMASGTPVVASNIPGIDEQITPHENGLLHPVGDVRTIADHIVRILQAPALAVKFSNAGRRLVQEKYDWGIIGARTEEAFVLATEVSRRVAA